MGFIREEMVYGDIRILNIVDDYSRVCDGHLVDVSISGERMSCCLGQLRESRGFPKTLVMDKGPEMTCKAKFFWSQQTQVKVHFIQSGKLTQNTFIKSFNGKFRDGCLNQHWFLDFNDA